MNEYVSHDCRHTSLLAVNMQIQGLKALKAWWQSVAIKTKKIIEKWVENEYTNNRDLEEICFSFISSNERAESGKKKIYIYIYIWVPLRDRTECLLPKRLITFLKAGNLETVVMTWFDNILILFPNSAIFVIVRAWEEKKRKCCPSFAIAF